MILSGPRLRNTGFCVMSWRLGEMLTHKKTPSVEAVGANSSMAFKCPRKECKLETWDALNQVIGRDHLQVMPDCDWKLQFQLFQLFELFQLLVVILSILKSLFVPFPSIFDLHWGGPSIFPGDRPELTPEGFRLGAHSVLGWTGWTMQNTSEMRNLVMSFISWPSDSIIFHLPAETSAGCFPQFHPLPRKGRERNLPALFLSSDHLTEL